MKVFVAILLMGLLATPLLAQDKKAVPTLADMKKDLIILNLRKDNMNLRYPNLTAAIKRLESQIKKAEKQKSKQKPKKAAEAKKE